MDEFQRIQKLFLSVLHLYRGFIAYIDNSSYLDRYL